MSSVRPTFLFDAVMTQLSFAKEDHEAGERQGALAHIEIAQRTLRALEEELRCRDAARQAAEGEYGRFREARS